MKYLINNNITRVLICWILTTQGTLAQYSDQIWCFGDSAGIDFSIGSNPLAFSTNLRTRGSCVSIADGNANLLFYAYTRAGLAGETTIVRDSSHNLMLNGDNIVGQGWFNELVIVPMPGQSNLFYLFCNGVTNSGSEGLYYSLIDLNLNGGLGEVVQKNVLVSTADYADALIGIKHANGRDYWLITHLFNGSNHFDIFLISPNGITILNSQNIGQQSATDISRFSYSYITQKFLMINLIGQIQVLDFDRCTGDFTNPVAIENPSVYSKPYFGCSISPSGRYGYVTNTSNLNDSLLLYQYDLLSSNIPQSRQLIYKQPVPASGGLHALGPDGRIYISSLYAYGYPYSDTIHNVYSDNLSVINYPDSAGMACDFQPFSFYLGGRRAYWGLPNNPVYNAGAVSGSVCDTLVGLSEHDQEIPPKLKLLYLQEYGKIFVNVSGLKSGKVFICISDLSGRVIAEISEDVTNGYMTCDMDVTNFATGVYTVSALSGKWRTAEKAIIWH